MAHWKPGRIENLLNRSSLGLELKTPGLELTFKHLSESTELNASGRLFHSLGAID